MILADMNAGKVAIVGKKPREMITTIPCPRLTTCDGRITGSYDELSKMWIFRCNKCGITWGIGKEIPKEKKCQ